MPALVSAFLVVAAMYLLTGFLFAVPFVLVGAARLDAAARDATWGFRLMILPGVAVFWPWLAWRWVSGRRVTEHNAHRARARAHVS